MPSGVVPHTWSGAHYTVPRTHTATSVLAGLSTVDVFGTLAGGHLESHLSSTSALRGTKGGGPTSM